MSQGRRTTPLVVAVAALSGLAGSVAVGLLSAPRAGPAFDQTLVRIASDLNKSLPMMIDAETRLENVVAGPGRTVIYRYTLVNYTKAADFDPSDFAESVRPTAANQYRTSDGMRRFREGGVTMRYHYSDREGVFLTEVVIGPGGAGVARAAAG